MKKLALALTAIAAFTGQAVAADMPARIAKAPVVAPIPVANWTGFWISGGFGYGLYDVDHSVVSTAVPPTTFDLGHDNGGRGWLGKVGVGGDYQFAGPFGNWVIGAFADAQWSDISGNYDFRCPGGCTGPSGLVGNLKNDWSWAVGGRLGYVALPGLLTYVNGGWTQSHWNQVNFVNNPTGAATDVILPSRTRDGWFLGGGTEYAITQLPGLFWKSEYRFADYGAKDLVQTCGPVTCGTPVGTPHSVDRSHAFVQTITTELVYRFNWGGPVVAKY